MIIIKEIREKSIKEIAKMGYPVNENLPLIEQCKITRSIDSILDRMLAMHIVGACAYGFGKKRGLAWLSRETNDLILTPTEMKFLHNEIDNRRIFSEQIEGLYSLAWSMSFFEELDFLKSCPDNLALMFPDLFQDQQSGFFRNSAMLRLEEDIYHKLDLSYCLHWAVREATLKGQMIVNLIPTYIVVERRRALEWLFTEEPWEEIALDT